jgi:hypothetical protein
VQALLAAAGDCPHHDLAALRDYFALYSQARQTKAAVMRHVFGPRLADAALKPGRLMRLALPRYGLPAAPAVLLHLCTPPNADRLGTLSSRSPLSFLFLSSLSLSFSFS